MGHDKGHTRDYDPQRFRNLALYVAAKSGDDPKFGKTKLAKVLFYSDFLAYTELGDSITGAIYSKFPRGPFPRVMATELRQIAHDGTGAMVPTNYFGKAQERLVPLARPDISGFTAEEIALVDSVIDELKDEDAASVSELSHQEPAWMFVDDLAPIPYELAWIDSGPPSEEVIRIGLETAAKIAQHA